MIPRHDMYNNVHKGLRRSLCLLLTQAGTADATRAAQSVVASSWHDLQVLLDAHHHHEDVFIAPHLSKLVPALAARIADDHTAMHLKMAELTSLAEQLKLADALSLPSLSRLFYRQLARFVADYLAHMADEESACLEALQNAYSDAALAGIEGALVASIEPGLMGLFSNTMFAAMNASECFALLDGARREAPPFVFEGMRAQCEGAVSAETWRVIASKLATRSEQVARA